MNATSGKWIIMAGIVVVLVGLVVYFLGDKLAWMGRLPGDIRVERNDFTFYFPITTMLLASLIITTIVRLAQKFL